MRIIPDFYGWLEHHPMVAILTVLIAGGVASVVMALIIAFSRPLY